MSHTKKIIVITTGGTIGSLLGEQSVAVDTTEVNQSLVAQEIHQAAKRLHCHIELIAPFTKNSENLRPEDWSSLLQTVSDANKSDCDGIVVTHGTDTMEYSLAAVAAYSHLWKKPVCFAGAFHAPDHPHSDAGVSLAGALACACNSDIEQGVYLSFRADTSHETAAITPAAAVKPMPFDQQYFEVLYGQQPGCYELSSGQWRSLPKSVQATLNLGVKKLPSHEALQLSSERVALLKVYPGMDTALLEAAARERDFLILEGYHCGTAPAEGGDLLPFAQSTDIDVLLAAYPAQYIGKPYSSTCQLQSADIHIYSDIQAHYLYVFCVLGLASGLNRQQVLQALQGFKI